MNKKLIVFIVVLSLVVIIAVAFTVCSCWRPYTLKESSRIVLQIGEKNVVLTPNDSAFARTHKFIKQTLNSARFSIIFARAQVKMLCSDENVAFEKSSNDIWIEVFSDKGKYRKLFFVLNKDEEKQFIRVFATQSDSFNNGVFLSYNNCNCKQLINLLQSI